MILRNGVRGYNGFACDGQFSQRGMNQYQVLVGSLVIDANDPTRNEPVAVLTPAEELVPYLFCTDNTLRVPGRWREIDLGICSFRRSGEYVEVVFTRSPTCGDPACP